ncbi:MAG: hypothetical protein M1133_08000 [Armatimonadetes bacterium]|nr:hypothetical protein [Armatimonadota bacterium]
MRVIKSRRGTGLVDVMVTMFLFAVAGIVFAASFPTGFRTTRQAQEYKIASAIAQKKVEQLRAMNYESLTFTLMLSAGVIDSTPGASPYSFTTTDGLASQLTDGTGSIYVSNQSSDVKRVRVVVSWHGVNDENPRLFEVNALFADKRTRKMN